MAKVKSSNRVNSIEEVDQMMDLQVPAARTSEASKNRPKKVMKKGQEGRNEGQRPGRKGPKG